MFSVRFGFPRFEEGRGSAGDDGKEERDFISPSHRRLRTIAVIVSLNRSSPLTK